MAQSGPAPSEAWLNSIFSSDPRRDIKKSSKSTSRPPIYVPMQNRIMYAEGDNEATALLFLKYFQINGLVTRFKAQPFYLDEVGGPAGQIPDILAELSDGSLHVIECKSKRFITEAVQEKFDIARSLIEPLGFNFHVWTDRDKLCGINVEGIRYWDRGIRAPIDQDRIDSIAQRADQLIELHALVLEFGWDEVSSAVGQGALFLNFEEKIDENSKIYRSFPHFHKRNFFETRNVAIEWWESLET